MAWIWIKSGKMSWLYWFIGLWTVVNGRPIDMGHGTTEAQQTQEDSNWDYLVRYGYVSTDLAALSPSRHVYNQAIRKFAEDIGEDGADHERLAELMRAPRCAKTLTDLERRRRGKRFVAHVTKWNHKDIRWRFRDPFEIFQNRTDFDIAKETLAHAFAMWSLASKHALQFQDLSALNDSDDDIGAGSRNGTSKVDIDIFFAAGGHGDHEPFDGRGGIVAHSGYPPEGKIHFDASELWMINGDSGIDLRYVTLHETGHALGLRHSKHKGAIMHPIYRRKTHEIALSEDDIKGIRYLYPADKTAQDKYSSLILRNRNRANGVKKLPPIDFEDY